MVAVSVGIDGHRWAGKKDVVASVGCDVMMFRGQCGNEGT